MSIESSTMDNLALAILNKKKGSMGFEDYLLDKYAKKDTANEKRKKINKKKRDKNN